MTPPTWRQWDSPNRPPRPGGHTGLLTHARQLLERVATLPDPRRFALRDLCPVDAAKYLTAFERLAEAGYLERVSESNSKWHYALTGKGLAVLTGEEELKLSGTDHD